MDTCDLLLLLLKVTTDVISPPTVSRTYNSELSNEDCTTAAQCHPTEVATFSSSIATSVPSTRSGATMINIMNNKENEHSGNISDNSASPDALSATTLVAMQWKSHAALQRMTQLLQTTRGDNGSIDVSEEREQRRLSANEDETVGGLAEQSISLAIECALSHPCTRTVLLAFHAVMV